MAAANNRADYSTAARAAQLWEALENYWAREDALIQGADARTFHALCPLHEFPQRSLDVVVTDADAALWPRCGCCTDDIWIALGLAEVAG